MINNLKNNTMLNNIFSLGSATLINAILTFLVGILTRNVLGPELYGYWLTISLIFTFTPILQLGTLNAMNREVPFYLARNDIKIVYDIRSSVFSFMFTIPLFSVLLLLVLSGILFFTDIRFEYKIGLMIASLIAGFTYISSYVEMYYKSEQNFRKASKIISIKSISQSILTVLFVYIFGYTGLYFGMLFSLIIEVALAKETFPKLGAKHTYKEYMDLIRVGFPILLVGIIWSIMIATDRIIISIYMTPEDLGNYGVGMLVFSTMMLIPQVISQVFYPKIVELVSKRNFIEIKRFYWKINKILALIMFFIVIIGYLLLPYFITWFMPEYINGIKAAQILLIGIYPLTLVGVSANYFNATNNQKVYIFIQIIGILLNVIIGVLLLKINNFITSISYATSISFAIYCILMNTFFIIKIKETIKKEPAASN
ncbi:oligosaccharide flippase family protein [Neobacillus pocheonensis]|uniref:oligosaccharide flippase family protein n=1 Tax=Neobacillus pocheonensis TaxID=363869 RepID=UPI003D27B126